MKNVLLIFLKNHYVLNLLHLTHLWLKSFYEFFSHKNMSSYSIIILKNVLDNTIFINFDRYDDINELNDVVYNSFTDYNPSILISLKYVINYEVKTFVNTIINTYKISKNQLLELLNRFNYLSHLEEYILNKNYIFRLLGSRSEQDEELLYFAMEYLYDTYEKDADFFNLEDKYSHIVIMSYKDRYYGHIYIDLKERKIIGLRTSLYNLLCENHGFLKITDVGIYLLDGCVKIAKDNNLEELFFENTNPIIEKVCKDYGFDENNRLDLTNFQKDFTINVCIQNDS